MTLDRKRLHPVRVALRHRFRGVDHRDAVLIEGTAGWGEFSPFPEYSNQVAAVWLAAALEAADAGWPSPIRDRVPVNVTVPAVGPALAADIVRVSGCSTAKVKVAEPNQTFADDLARVDAVRDALGGAGRIRLDANGSWTLPQAVTRLTELATFGLEYCEQPVAGLDEMKELRRRVDVPLAADESVRSGSSAEALRESVDVVVLKVQPMGGVAASLAFAEALDLPVVVSSALETSIGIGAGLALAAALPNLPYACGLATVLLLQTDVVDDPLLPVDGFIELRHSPPNRASLTELRSPLSTELLERVDAAYEVLPA